MLDGAPPSRSRVAPDRIRAPWPLTHPAEDPTMNRTPTPLITLAAWIVVAAGAAASSHMDAPAVTLDDAANTTDVYAFVSEQGGTKYLTTALAVFPFEEPGIGPNAYRFDDDVRYELHVSLGDDVASGAATLTYRFEFDTTFKNTDTILQSYLGPVTSIGDAGQNLAQTYTVTQIDHRTASALPIGGGRVPPNNQGIATPSYNVDGDGDQPAASGATSFTELDPLTLEAISFLEKGHVAFAGQRDDGFYGDIQAIFDLLQLKDPSESFDSQGGFNVHTIVLNIPVEELGGDLQMAGVHATTSRLDGATGRYRQVARQGNPLFCEGFVALIDKDRYNETPPTQDDELFDGYALEPELAELINALLDLPFEAVTTDRTDLEGIFIPDLIKVDLSTGPARLAGGPSFGVPDDPGFSRLGLFDPRQPDVLVSRIQDGFFGTGEIPGGFPNGRRFGDDVVDIGITAIISDLRDPDDLVINVADGIDAVSENDIAYNKVFPYAATPINGRAHDHH